MSSHNRIICLVVPLALDQTQTVQEKYLRSSRGFFRGCQVLKKHLLRTPWATQTRVTPRSMSHNYTFAIVLILFLLPWEISWPKKQLREQGIYFSSKFKVVPHHFKKVTVVGAGDSWWHHIYRRDRETECVHACLCSARRQCSYTAQDPCLGNSAAHTGLGLFTSINLIKTTPTPTVSP